MSPPSVFLSRPTSLASQQKSFCLDIARALEEEGFRPRTLGATDYPSRAPLGEVLDVMLDCKGALILGLRQLRVLSGILKEDTVKQSNVSQMHLPTPWNQIEAGIAVALNLPLLLIREEGVSGGVFDVGASDRFLHQATMTTDWTRSDAFRKPFLDWISDVRESTQLESV